MIKTVDIAIIGAGLTGLTCAYYLNKQSKNFIVLEKKSHPGGVIHTVKENGFTYEEGPNTGVIGNPDVAELFEELNHSCSLETASDKVKKRYILKNEKWEPLPMGLAQAVKTPLFSLKDKFRLLGEPFRKKGTNPEESLAELVRRRMGESFLNYAIDPFILGVYSGDPAMLITKYAFPKLYNLEQNYGSFIGGSVKKMFEKKSERDKKATRKVFSVKGGLSNLTNSLYHAAGSDNFLFSIDGLKINFIDNQYIISGIIQNETFEIKANKVITTIGAYALSDLLPFVDNNLIQKIEKLKYAKVLQTIIGFNKWEGMTLDGFGGLIPFIEKRDILGVLFLSALLSDKAPENGALLSVFIGGVRREEMYSKTDDEIKTIVEKEVKPIMNLKDFNPDLFKIIRYKYAIPQYSHESKDKIDAIASIQNQYKGLILGGNIRDGIGMADRIKQGKEIAYSIS